MKVAIAYPPLESEKGIPLLSQNRQFQWFKSPTYIYPVIPAYAATLLKQHGFEVAWLDGIARGQTYADWLMNLRQIRPDVVVVESKTPVIKWHWRMINEWKTQIPDVVTVLVGDHVTALPMESLNQSSVDYVLTGGDYDFALSDLCSHLVNSNVALPPGVYIRSNQTIVSTGRFSLHKSLNELPHIDRDLTCWRLYSELNGNFRDRPGTYIMSARDCWHAKCSFCSWAQMYPQYRVRSPSDVVNELEELVLERGVHEVMDDSGTFPIGAWLGEFCRLMMESPIRGKVAIDCNMRFGALSQSDYELMKKAGFRLLLFGLESGNQATLDKLGKGFSLEEAIVDCKQARAAGLYPHISVMYGHPWEDYSEALNTFKLVEDLIRKNWVFTVQASIVTPYPGTPLFEECDRLGLLLTRDWDRYDMTELVVECPLSLDQVMMMIRHTYGLMASGSFFLRRAITAQELADLRYLKWGIAKVLSRMRDFSGKKRLVAHR